MAKKRIRPTSKNYGLRTTNYIRSRIAVPRTEEENQSNFIIRELVQNADDVKARSLVLRQPVKRDHRDVYRAHLPALV